MGWKWLRRKGTWGKNEAGSSFVASESSSGAAAGYVEAPLGAMFLVLPSYADNRPSDYHLRVDETDLFYKDLAK